MAYSAFTLAAVAERFNLTLLEDQDLFPDAPEREPSPLLSQILGEWAPLALAMNTEKGKSELIIAPILMETRRHSLDAANAHPISVFSGVEFNVDPALGLNGACDFLICRSPERYFVKAPVVAIVESKKDDFVGGLGQCLAAVVAARIFNEREGVDFNAIHGAVTTGELWRFVRLRETTAWIDVRSYHLRELPRILGILATLAGIS